jgi:hypothetical protein
MRMKRMLKEGLCRLLAWGACAGLCGCATRPAVPENTAGPAPVPVEQSAAVHEGEGAPPAPAVDPAPQQAEVPAAPPPPAQEDGLNALQRAWRSATPEEREEFRRWMMDAGG